MDNAANRSERLADKTAAQADYADEHGSVPGTPANKQTDLEQATKIRKALLRADGLSTNARNVNVMVDQGRVTLHGRVESDVEKARVEEMAPVDGRCRAHRQRAGGGSLSAQPRIHLGQSQSGCA